MTIAYRVFGPEAVANLTMGSVIFLSMCQPSNDSPVAKSSVEQGASSPCEERVCPGEVCENSYGVGGRVLRRFRQQTERPLMQGSGTGQLWHLLLGSSL